MGFYGNISNVNRTQFSFDRIYSSRKAMEQSRIGDGVYLGRFVLVEYDNEGLDGLQQAYRKNGTNTLYQDSSCNIPLTKSAMMKNTVVYVLENEIYSFYRCTSDFVEADNTAATFEVINEITPNAPAYTRNYFIDTEAYGAGRGYDSTVWQKVYADGNEKYVMIAELNTVVPKFEVAADAPTMNPIAPHFDTQSTDVYYKLHVQTPWGFRVAAASDDSKSDQTTTWTTYDYNENEGIHEERTEEKNAAIYFNKDAFDPQVHDGTSIIRIKKHDDDTSDEIKISLASSGQAIYDDHDNTTTNTIPGNDIQELTINLPAIGNMMSDAWDIIHGPNRDNARTDDNGSLQGRLDSFKDMASDEIPVKRGSDGTIIGATINGGKTSLDDLTGKNDDAWIETKVNGDIESITIKHTFNQVSDTITTADKNSSDGDGFNSGIGDSLKLYTPKVDAMGHVVGKNIETVILPYSFKTIKTNGESNSTADMTITTDNIIADTTQDELNINAGNKWLHIATNATNDTITFAHEVNSIETAANGTTNMNNESTARDENNINIPDWTYDEAGHITSKQNHYYTLPFGFKNISTNGRSDEISENATSIPVTSNVVADTTQDTLAINSGNKWIRIDTDVSGDSLTIRHDVHETSSDSNTTDWTTTETNTTIPTVTYAYDEAGHYVSHHTENYKLPFGYGKIKGDNDTSTAATATYDELTFTSDEWFTATVSKDQVVYSHDYPKKVDDTDSTSNVNGNGDTIVLETLERDEKGHVVKVNQNTVTLPYGYKTFKDSEVTPGQSIANSTQDTFVFKGDNWIKPVVTDDLLTLTHEGPVSVNALKVEDVTPNFGGTFTITDWYFDNKGHKSSSNTHTIKIPMPSLTSETGNVVTELSLVPETGAFTVTKNNISNLLLTDYSKKTNNDDIASTDALGDALSKLQTQIHDTETVISNLDYNETADNTKIITQITQTDGKITNVVRAAAGTLVLGDNYSKATASAALTTRDSLNTAFGKIEKSLEETNTRISNLIGDGQLNEAFDTLKEVSDWLAANDTGADKIIDDIAILNGVDTVEGSVAHSIAQAIATEVDDRNTAIDNKINTLNVVDTALSGQYVSAVSEENGKVIVSREALPTYTLTPGSTNGAVAFNGADVAITGLGSAAYTNSDAYDVAGAALAVQNQLQKYPTLEQRFKFSVNSVDASRSEYTIEELFTIVAVIREQTRIMHQEISELRSEIDKLKNK